MANLPPLSDARDRLSSTQGPGSQPQVTSRIALDLMQQGGVFVLLQLSKSGKTDVVGLGGDKTHAMSSI